MTDAKTEESKPIYHYGRGGAGNVTVKTSKDKVTKEGMKTPTLKAKIYTTGRGGTGNMAKNDDPEEARAAQDVDTPPITLPEGPHSTGRGGAANMYTPNSVERLEAKEHNERIRRESFKSSSRERAAGIKAVVGIGVGKGKEAVKEKS